MTNKNYLSLLGEKYAQSESTVRVLVDIFSKAHFPVFLINAISRTIYISQGHIIPFQR